MRLFALPAVALCVLAAGCGSARPLGPPHFQAGAGWHVGTQAAHTCPGVSRTRCVQASGWASTVSYRDCGDCVPPRRTLAGLPADGIVIQVLNAREKPSRMLPAGWPPPIRVADVIHGPFDGVPARYGEVGRSGRTGGAEWSLYIWFGQAPPTPRQVARANAELRTVGF